MKKEKLEEYIIRAKEIHGDKYDYSKTNPDTCKDKCIVTCSKHGDFETTLDGHVNGRNRCPHCAGKIKITNESFIEKARKIHGDLYDYSKINYINSNEKICIVCPVHGEFWQAPKHHLSGVKCPRCSNRVRLTSEEWIENAKKVHGDAYDYSKVEYVNNKTKVCITCPIHGDFYQAPSSHLTGVKCPKCKGGVVLTTKEWLEKAKEVHGDRYNYSKVEYVNAKTKVCIICHRHGEFWQGASSHLTGKGCPKCKSSKLENIIIEALNKNDINYVFQYKIKELGIKSLDFYLPEYNIVIECQGEQHYVETDFSKHKSAEEMKEDLNNRMELDKLKYDVCYKHNIEIIYFTIPQYFHVKNVNIYTKFYRDKKVYTDLKSLIEYIKGCKKNNVNNSFNDLFKNLLLSCTNIVSQDNVIMFRNYAIIYHKLLPNDKDSLLVVNRFYRKRKIKCVHVFEDEYALHKDIVLSKLKHILNADNNAMKVYGRKCVIKKIDNSTSCDFLEKYHIQGFANSTVYLGAYYNNELIAVMSFLKENDGNWNLTRFASDYNYICCGVGGKLFNYFIKEYNPSEVKSFADRRWTINETDNVYTKLGFTVDYVLSPEYRYYNSKIDKYKRFHKFGFRKDVLHKKYGLPLTMTEREMTKELGYDRIWDCGLIKYVWKNDK